VADEGPACGAVAASTLAPITIDPNKVFIPIRILSV
jgi:hypothetical protein